MMRTHLRTSSGGSGIVRPCVVAFWDEAFFPDVLFGPVLFCALARFVRFWRSVVIGLEEFRVLQNVDSPLRSNFTILEHQDPPALFQLNDPAVQCLVFMKGIEIGASLDVVFVDLVCRETDERLSARTRGGQAPGQLMTRRIC